MKNKYTEEEALLVRLKKTRESIDNLKTEIYEDVIKKFQEIKQKDLDLDEGQNKEINTLNIQLNDKMNRMVEEMKNNSRKLYEDKINLQCELQELRESNAKLIENGLKMLQSIELLEMRIGKTKLK